MMAPEVQSAFIAGVFSLLVAIVGLLSVHMSKSRKVMKEVRDQVSNGHDTNLRDDITEIMRVQSQHTEDIGVLKLDGSWTRRELQDLDHRIHRIEGKAA